MSGGMDALRNVFTSGGWDPLRFWERILDASQEAGLDGIEITFAPGDWHSAKKAYGSASGFASALKVHGLEVCSGFFSTRLPGSGRYGNFGDPADHAQLLEMADAYAEFLQGCGSEILITALPLRASRDADPPLFVDLRLAETIADLVNRMG
jgi:inosose dehydratase